MKNLDLIMVLITTAMLCSCGDSTGDSGDTDGPITTSMSGTKIIVDRGDGFLVTEKPVCRQGVYSSKLDTGYYSLAQSSLLVWSKEDCQSDVYVGNSPTIEGVWNLVDSVAPIPGGALPNCEDISSVLNWMSNISVTVTISTTDVRTTGSLDICMAQGMGEDPDMSAMGMVADGCNRLKWTLNGDVALMQITAFDIQNESMTMRFSFKGATCDMISLPKVAPSQEACTYSWTKFVNEDDPDEEWDEEDFMKNPGDEALMIQWQECMATTGFGQGGNSALTKKALSKIKFPTKRFM